MIPWGEIYLWLCSPEARPPRVGLAIYITLWPHILFVWFVSQQESGEDTKWVWKLLWPSPWQKKNQACVSAPGAGPRSNFIKLKVKKGLKNEIKHIRVITLVHRDVHNIWTVGNCEKLYILRFLRHLDRDVDTLGTRWRGPTVICASCCCTCEWFIYGSSKNRLIGYTVTPCL